MVRLKVAPPWLPVLPVARFQFLDGAIKRKHSSFFNARKKGFNSLMVRLKARFYWKICLRDTSFNSLMVRLKEKYDALYQKAVDAFQFLDGAIKSLLTLMNRYGLSKFQFLDGAIKSSRAVHAVPAFKGFNSLMVRLKDRKRKHWGKF